MGTPYIGEIKMVGFGFAPRGYALADGGSMNIANNQALFSLFGTTYGGNGITTFFLPDLRGRTPIGYGNALNGAATQIGEVGGQEGVTLLTTQIPAHTHPLTGTTVTGDKRPANGSRFAADSRSDVQFYEAPTSLIPLAPGSIANTGGNQSHNNMQPYVVINFAVALEGVFPSRN